MNYWEEVLCEALDSMGIPIPSDETLRLGSKTIESGHECFGSMHGHECIPNPISLDNERLRKKLEIEISKVGCKECGGSGRLEYMSGPLACNSQCDRCAGEGKHL